MANITISELRPAGADLLFDSESYLTDLTESETLGTQGGATFLLGVAVGLAISHLLRN
ncbi:hypothetical protein [Microcystis aeruginosa]|uniref:hypothetical protein n=1 Tax=Microcystis aeruginosa TaxID=1126 RepID=UPI00187FA03F|nr:hypothetical protein [Microcystis aeruginosa]MBE8995436.1 hypothetical protein [Microcystis aeruginosa LEGE 91341]